MNGTVRMALPSARVMCPTRESGGGCRMFFSRVERRMAFFPGVDPNSFDAHAVDLEAEFPGSHRADADHLDARQVRAAEVLQRHTHLLPVRARNEAVHRGHGVDARSHD